MESATIFRRCSPGHQVHLQRRGSGRESCRRHREYFQGLCREGGQERYYSTTGRCDRPDWSYGQVVHLRPPHLRLERPDRGRERAPATRRHLASFSPSSSPLQTLMGRFELGEDFTGFAKSGVDRVQFCYWAVVRRSTTKPSTWAMLIASR